MKQRAEAKAGVDLEHAKEQARFEPVLDGRDRMARAGSERNATRIPAFASRGLPDRRDKQTARAGLPGSGRGRADATAHASVHGRGTDNLAHEFSALRPGQPYAVPAFTEISTTSKFWLDRRFVPDHPFWTEPAIATLRQGTYLTDQPFLDQVHRQPLPPGTYRLRMVAILGDVAHQRTFTSDWKELRSPCDDCRAAGGRMVGAHAIERLSVPCWAESLPSRREGLRSRPGGTLDFRRRTSGAQWRHVGRRCRLTKWSTPLNKSWIDRGKKKKKKKHGWIGPVAKCRTIRVETPFYPARRELAVGSRHVSRERITRLDFASPALDGSRAGRLQNPNDLGACYRLFEGRAAAARNWWPGRSTGGAPVAAGLLHVELRGAARRSGRGRAVWARARRVYGCVSRAARRLRRGAWRHALLDEIGELRPARRPRC